MKGLLVLPYSGDSDVVHKSQNETITGQKTFSSNILANTITATGDIQALSFTAMSSRTKKRDISPVTFSATDLLTQVEVVKFRYNREYDEEGTIHYGFIAEDSPIQLTDDGCHMDYTNCIGILIKAVQELDKRLKANNM